MEEETFKISAEFLFLLFEFNLTRMGCFRHRNRRDLHRYAMAGEANKQQ